MEFRKRVVAKSLELVASLDGKIYIDENTASWLYFERIALQNSRRVLGGVRRLEIGDSGGGKSPSGVENSLRWSALRLVWDQVVGNRAHRAADSRTLSCSRRSSRGRESRLYL